MRVCDNGDGRQHYGLGLCQRCYQRQRAAARRPPKPPPAQCLDCSEPVKSRLRCERCHDRHYSSERRRARGAPIRQQHTDCQIEGCNRPHKARHYCQMHYNAFIRSKTTDYQGQQPGGVFARLWQDPERRAALRQAQSEGAKRRWADRRAQAKDPS